MAVLRRRGDDLIGSECLSEHDRRVGRQLDEDNAAVWGAAYGWPCKWESKSRTVAHVSRNPSDLVGVVAE